MTPMNLLPLRDRASVSRRWLVGSWLGLSALGGGGLVAWTLHAQDASKAHVQAEMARAQMQLDQLQLQLAQQRKLQLQAQQTHALWHQVQALRQRAQRLDALHKVTAQRWPAGVQVQEWRLDGAGWRLQGLADSGGAVQQLLQDLLPLGPWQQAPAVVELAATPVVSGSNARGLRYVVQARWQETELAPQARSPAPASAQPLTSVIK